MRYNKLTICISFELMKKIIKLLFITMWLSSCIGVKRYNTQISSLHSVAELHEDVDKAHSQLQKLHPKLYQYVSKSKLDSKFEILKNDIDRPMGSSEFYERLAPVLKEVRQGHLMSRPPTLRFTKAQLKALNKLKFEFNDLDFEILEDKLWVKGTLGKDSTLVGDEVLAVDKESSKKLVGKYEKLFSSDGFNTTYYDRYVGRNFSNFYYSEKGFKDSLTLLLKRNDSIYFRTFRWIGKGGMAKKDSSAHKTPQKVSKADKIIFKEKQKAKKKEGRTRGYIPSRDYYLRNFDFIGQDNSVAYLKIRGFGHGNQKKFYKEIFAKIDSAKCDNLIIDLRDNGGGNLEEIENLYGYLALEPFKFINKAETKTNIPATKAMFSKTGVGFFGSTIRIFAAPGVLAYDLLHSKKEGSKKYYKLTKSKLKKPKDNNFKGKIYVLTNGYSFSASSIISANLQATKRAIFVGEETGGSYNGTVAGQSKFVTLPNSKVRMKFGMLQIETPYKTERNGYGVKPDIEIIPTPQDRVQKRDPELDWVLEDILKN